LSISGIDLFGFRLGQVFKRLRHALHPIRVILLDQAFIGAFHLFNRRRIGNAENMNPTFIAERSLDLRLALAILKLAFIDGPVRPNIR
jgi:hypothetical protein